MLEEDRIIKINIENEMKSAYIDYSMSVIVSRALPDVRDGLKPVHRRVLFGMNEMGNNSDKPHKKAAKAVGEKSIEMIHQKELHNRPHGAALGDARMPGGRPR